MPTEPRFVCDNLLLVLSCHEQHILTDSLDGEAWKTGQKSIVCSLRECSHFFPITKGQLSIYSIKRSPAVQIDSHFSFKYIL